MNTTEAESVNSKKYQSKGQCTLSIKNKEKQQKTQKWAKKEMCQ